MAQALHSLDEPRPLTTRSRIWITVILVVYGAVVTLAFFGTQRPMPELPTVALMHAMLASFISGVTALLMYSHGWIAGRRGYLMIAGIFAYLFGLLLFYPMYFIGAIVPDERVWGGPQTSVSLYFAWHFAFPIGLAISALVIYSDQHRHRRPGLRRHQKVLGVVLPLMAIAFTLWLVNSGLLPDIIDAGGGELLYGRNLDRLLVGVSVVSVVVTLYCARNGSMIGRWLVALALLVLGESLVSVQTSERYTLGWYSSRLLWLVAIAGLLIALIWNLSRIDRANTELAAADSLTGAESRMSLLEELEREIARARVVDGRVALLWLDLDGFKTVNDQLGHPSGDSVLRTIADRLVHQVRRGDHVARLGGDEFGVLLCDDVQPARVNAVADRLLAGVREPIRVSDNVVHVSAAIGIASAPTHATRAEDLLLFADLAMYAAKNRGGDRFEWFDETIATEAISKARLRHDLATALMQGDFCLYYQPIYEADGRKLAGVEALVRWMHNGEAVSAGEFVPFAEESGQIITLGRIVLRHLAQEVPRWLDNQGEKFFVCLNLSVKELADEALINEFLGGSLMDRPRQLVVEVTESLELQGDLEAQSNLERLRARGIRIAVDDFGAGFSNFSRLEDLQPSLLKIDRSLVRRAGSEDVGGVAFLSAAASVAASLNCEVIAEGVETESEAQVVHLLGLRYVQGFRYAEPAPIEAFLEPALSPWTPRA